MENIDNENLDMLCAEIKKLTKLNDHTGAIKIACCVLGYDDLHFVLSSIEMAQQQNGSLSSEMLFIRTKCFDKLMMNLYSDYCAKIYNDVKSSF